MGSIQSLETAKYPGQRLGKVDARLAAQLDAVEWGEFKIGDLFDIQTSKKRFDANKVTILESGKYPYVARTALNNGVRGYIDEDEQFLNEGNTISFGQDTATVFYQEKPYFTGDKIKIIKAKNNLLNKRNAQFFLPVMTKAFSSFAWGSSSFKVSIIENTKISLPVKNNHPNLDFMKNFVSELEARRTAELEAYLSAAGLKDYLLTVEEKRVLDTYHVIQWKNFKLENLFERITTRKLPFKAKELPKETTGNYTLSCLTSSFINQGLNYFVPKDGATILKNVISIPSNSDVYRAYFQSNEFTVLSDAYVIDWILDDVALSPNQYLFAVQCINKVTDLPIYSYKNKLGGWNVVKNKYIQLPIKEDKPDYEFMQTLISAVKKLAIKDVVQYADNKIAATQTVIQQNGKEAL